MKRALAVVVLAVLLPLGLAQPVSATDGEMSPKRAGKYYLKVTCAASDAAARYSRTVFQGKDEVTRAEVARRLKPLRAASRKLSDALYRAGRQLKNPPAAWPSGVSLYVSRYQANVLRMSNVLYSQSQAGSAVRWMNLYRKSSKVASKLGPIASKIRLELDLPPRGRGC